MTTDSKYQHWLVFDGESEQGFRQFKLRSYGVPQSTTLADASMQEGDTLPDDATYEIILSGIEMLKPLTQTIDGKRTTVHKGGRAVVMTGMKEKVEASGTDWSELSGTRDVDDTDPQVLRYKIRFTAATGTARPSVGDTYTAITGNASGFTTAGLDREPVVVWVGHRVKATILKSHINVVFQAHHARVSAGSPATEINPRRRVRTGRFTWKGTRRFSIPIASAVNFESTLYGSVFPNMSGSTAPKCVRVDTLDDPPGFPGRSLVVASYETPRVVGQGKLRIESMFAPNPTTKDLAGNVIVGPEPITAGSSTYHERRLISGSAIRPRPMTKIILETAATSLNLNTFIDKEGSVNKYNLPNFGNAQAGTLLFLGLPHTTFEFVNDLWYLNLAWAYSGDPKNWLKWNQQTVSQAGNFFPVKKPGITASGILVTGADKYALEWRANKVKTSSGVAGEQGIPTEPFTHKMFPEADFRAFGKNLAITGL